MKDRNIDNDKSGLTRRHLLGMATLTGAAVAAASMGTPAAKAVRQEYNEDEYNQDEGRHADLFQ